MNYVPNDEPHRPSEHYSKPPPPLRDVLVHALRERGFRRITLGFGEHANKVTVFDAGRRELPLVKYIARSITGQTTELVCFGRYIVISIPE